MEREREGEKGKEDKQCRLSRNGKKSACVDRYSVQTDTQTDLSHEAVSQDQPLRLTSPAPSHENRHSPLTVSKFLAPHP